jgi:[ribosomal protein S5]-alanine N-acetyltransferase
VSPARDPRLAGARVALVPVPQAVAVAVVRGEDPAPALAALALRPGPDWPHEDTATALHGAAASPPPWRTWLVALPGGTVVGECGWKGWPDSRGEVEVGYGLAPASRRRGLGTEAVGLLVAWSLGPGGARRVAAEVDAANAASRALLRRLGFAEQGPGPDGVLRAVLDPARPPGLRGRHVC